MMRPMRAEYDITGSKFGRKEEVIVLGFAVSPVDIPIAIIVMSDWPVVVLRRHGAAPRQGGAAGSPVADGLAFVNEPSTPQACALAALAVFDVWAIYGIVQHLIWRLT